MKKILFSFVFLCAFSLTASAEPKKAPIAAQYIITDCGTVHQIATNTTNDEIIDAIDEYSAEDC
jgi:hypothetical protein